MKNRYRIWLADGEPKNYEGDSADVKSIPEKGLTIKIKTIGKKVVTVTGAVGFTTIMPEKKLAA